MITCGKHRTHKTPDKIIKFFTQNPIFADSTQTKFEIIVKDAKNKVIETFETDCIEKNILFESDSKNIRVEITDFTELESAFLYTPVISLNLSALLPEGGKFSLEISQFNDYQSFSFIIEDVIFLRGNFPEGELKLDIVDPTYIFVSGIKYLSSANISYKLSSIKNLNAYAATDVKVSLSSTLLTNDFEYSDDQLTDYDFDFYNTTTEWNYIDELNFDSISSSILTDYEVSCSINNAFGSSDISCTIGNLLTYNNDRLSKIKSTNTSEYFVDELNRVKIVSSVINKWDSTEALNKNDGLQVIPGVGLCYPNLDLTETKTIPEQNIDYEPLYGFRYYIREFCYDIDRLIYSGAIKLDGITKNDFLSEDVSLALSVDGINWLNCKQDRGVMTDIQVEKVDGQEVITGFNCFGILDEILETESGIIVKFAFNNFNKDTDIKFIQGINPVYIKVGLNDGKNINNANTCFICIKSIELL